jgi:hypothetical protein
MKLAMQDFPSDAFGQLIDGFIERFETFGSGHAAITGGGHADIGLHDSVLGSSHAAG